MPGLIEPLKTQMLFVSTLICSQQWESIRKVELKALFALSQVPGGKCCPSLLCPLSSRSQQRLHWNFFPTNWVYRSNLRQEFKLSTPPGGFYKFEARLIYCKFQESQGYIKKLFQNNNQVTAADFLSIYLRQTALDVQKLGGKGCLLFKTIGEDPTVGKGEWSKWYSHSRGCRASLLDGMS